MSEHKSNQTEGLGAGSESSGGQVETSACL